MGIVSAKLRNSAKGEPCTFNIVGHCDGGYETTVLCHAPSEVKGMGNKSHDYWAAFGCSGCHTAMDEHRLSAGDAQFYWLRAIARTWDRWIARGLITIPVDPETAKRRPRKPSKIKNRPLAGTKESGLRKKMNGTVEARGQLWEQPSLGKEDRYGD